MTERYYLIDDRPRATEEHLVLADGSAVICSTSDEASAAAVASSTRRLKVRRHSELNKTDQKRVRSAI